MNPSNIFQHIDPEAIARDTLDFIKVRSETGAEGEGSQFLADLLQREGFTVRTEEVEPNRPNVYTMVEGIEPASGRALLFNGHTDTIPIGNSTPPGRDGDWLIGRGTEDMKGGLVAMVHGASALRKAGVQLKGNLWLTGVIGHETPVGKKEGPKRLIEHLQSGQIKTDAIIIVEGPCAIWAASLGSTIFHITIETDRGPVHTIKTQYVENPAYWTGRLLTEFQKLEETFAVTTSHRLCGRDQLNVGMVHGGDWFNRLPVSIKVTGTRRWTPGRTLHDVQSELQDLCQQLSVESGLSFVLSLEAASAREPFETPPDHPIINALQSAGQTVAGSVPDLIGMGLVGDANLYANDGGATTVYYGPAHETAHSNHERVSLSQLVHCAQVYALTAAHYCGGV
ncbi:M20/M25/M40 family metallo-hydrolase [Chloroflexi bacterium TSY]|nr:M20/M25/M40 family metallo-hydrolase [Chloroflexi bacterium TSY]